MIRFKEWLSKKNLSEFTALDPQTATSTIGTMVGAQQLNNPTNVATNLVTKYPQLAAAVMNDPKAEKLKAILDKNKNKNNPMQNNQQVPPGIGTTLNTGP